jgi:hypothetical protein
VCRQLNLLRSFCLLLQFNEVLKSKKSVLMLYRRKIEIGRPERFKVCDLNYFKNNVVLFYLGNVFLFPVFARLELG